MGVHQTPPYLSQQARTTKDIQFASGPRRRLLRLEKRLRLATVAPRVPALENRLLLVQEMAHRRHLRTIKRGAARAATSHSGEKPSAKRRNSRLAVSQDERGRRRAERLRWRKESARQEATPLGGYGRIGAQSQSAQRQS